MVDHISEKNHFIVIIILQFEIKFGQIGYFLCFFFISCFLSPTLSCNFHRPLPSITSSPPPSLGFFHLQYKRINARVAGRGLTWGDMPSLCLQERRTHSRPIYYSMSGPSPYSVLQFWDAGKIRNSSPIICEAENGKLSRPLPIYRYLENKQISKLKLQT